MVEVDDDDDDDEMMGAGAGDWGAGDAEADMAADSRTMAAVLYQEVRACRARRSRATAWACRDVHGAESRTDRKSGVTGDDVARWVSSSSSGTVTGFISSN